MGPKKTIIRALVLGAASIFVVVAAWAHTGRGHTSAPALASRVQTVLFQSRALGAQVSYAVLLPPDYSRTHRGGYPVVYALHG